MTCIFTYSKNTGRRSYQALHRIAEMTIQELIMTSTFEQQCPLCHNNAEHECRYSGNWKHFYCSKCKEFVISVSAERRLIKSIPQWRTALSNKARKSNKEKILVIRRATTTLMQEGVALSAEFMEYKKWI
jgi:hypothetical protein